jgi:hypothetical protein
MVNVEETDSLETLSLKVHQQKEYFSSVSEMVMT